MTNKEITPKIVSLVGPPGSGKGTQAGLLAERLGYNVIHVSQIIRDKFNNQPDSPDVTQAKQDYEAGKLVSGEVIARWVSEKINGLGKTVIESGLIIDGAGRTIEEASTIIDLLIKYIDKDDIKIFFVKISPEETLRRNTKRIVCTKCLKPINPKLIDTLDACPHCNGNLGKREMDQKSVIENRLKVYRELTLPTVEYMRERGLVVDINGEQTIEEVYQDINKHIKTS
jgi:adenylate kinase